MIKKNCGTFILWNSISVDFFVNAFGVRVLCVCECFVVWLLGNEGHNPTTSACGSENGVHSAGPKLWVNTQREESRISRNLVHGHGGPDSQAMALPPDRKAPLSPLPYCEQHWAGCLPPVPFPRVAPLVCLAALSASGGNWCPLVSELIAKENKPVPFCYAPSTLDRTTSCLLLLPKGQFCWDLEIVWELLWILGNFWIIPEFYM